MSELVKRLAEVARQVIEEGDGGMNLVSTGVEVAQCGLLVAGLETQLAQATELAAARGVSWQAAVDALTAQDATEVFIEEVREAVNKESGDKQKVRLCLRALAKLDAARKEKP